MATWRSVPRRPTALEMAAMMAGPVRNLTAMANVATLFRHAMIRSCSAMNSPASEETYVTSSDDEYIASDEEEAEYTDGDDEEDVVEEDDDDDAQEEDDDDDAREDEVKC
ncbi:hypothetical protein OsI_01737 [Oryza sativa Indica Group]|uniref:Uncharacterized protein n=1 Tax=Oryza sativa subsp. indica TaxID=39946 RepID=B8A7G5_ORYSI|nr:hypothetical protein OsI_01737 [Oryza sativa Indica Group]